MAGTATAAFCFIRRGSPCCRGRFCFGTGRPGTVVRETLCSYQGGLLLILLLFTMMMMMMVIRLHFWRRTENGSLSSLHCSFHLARP
jgi:hypothetical protein